MRSACRRAAGAVGQHAAGWCGGCYLIAAVLVAEDRAYIARKVVQRVKG